jgi:hypothetical protein
MFAAKNVIVSSWLSLSSKRHGRMDEFFTDTFSLFGLYLKHNRHQIHIKKRTMFLSKRGCQWLSPWDVVVRVMLVATMTLVSSVKAFNVGTTRTTTSHPAAALALLSRQSSTTFCKTLQQQSPLHRHRVLGGKTVLFRIRCENKYYQLEEMEDRENCTTELFLKEDGTVLIGDTDGPLWTSAVGEWAIASGTNDFVMTITKTYGAGQDNSDMGEFEYELERTFQGEMTEVGESVAITGVMVCDDPLTGKAQKVGFFNMIDGTDVRKDKRSDARSGTRDDFELEARQLNPVGVTGHDGIPSNFQRQQLPPTPAPSPNGGFGVPPQDPYLYDPSIWQPDPYSLQHPVLSYEEQLRQQQRGFTNGGGGYGQGEPTTQPQADPYSSYYNQNQSPPKDSPCGYSQSSAPSEMGSGYERAPPPPQQDSYGYSSRGGGGYRPSLDPFGGGNFESQNPRPSEAFGGYGQRSYGMYEPDDSGYGGLSSPPAYSNDPYGEYDSTMPTNGGFPYGD